MAVALASKFIRLFVQTITYLLLGLIEKRIFDFKSSSKIIAKVFGYLLVLCTSSIGCQVVHAENMTENPNVATIDFVKGYAVIFPNREYTAGVYAKQRMKIKENDLIFTGDNGFISFSFSNGTVVNIQPLSKISVEKIDCQSNSDQCRLKLNTSKGNIDANVESQSDHDTQFTIETPYASAAVRGTIFDIDVNDDRLLAAVTEGKVNVSTESDSVEIPENFGTQVQKNKPPTPPKPLLTAPEFVAGPTRYDVGSELAWNSVSMAKEYLISLSNTFGTIYNKQSSDTQHHLQPLDAGTYTAQLRAIDKVGFRGQITSREINVVDTVASSTGPNLTTTVDDTEYTVVAGSQNAAANLVELHFSATDDFKKIVHLDVFTEEVLSSDRADNDIYIRGRYILNNAEVTPFGPIVKIPGK